MAKKLETFHVYARVLLDTSIKIRGETLEDALQKSRELKVSDFVDILGENCDNELKITGVYEDYKMLNLK
jgi:hypothetical protein